MPYPVLDSEHLVPVDTTDVDRKTTQHHTVTALSLSGRRHLCHLMGTHADFSSESIYALTKEILISIQLPALFNHASLYLKGTPKTGCGM